jgi:hypothetical protein
MPTKKVTKKTTTASKPKPSDLGTGGARKAADAIMKRKQMLNEI